jgi:GNAT superfamily N-acetyltransferase
MRRGTQEADLRPARPDELMACAAIWRVAINHYTERLDQPPIPDDLASIMTLYTHLQATDPELFVVATRPDTGASGGERVIGFAAAVVRGTAWYLSMLFVLPEEQGLGLGRALLERVLPPADAGMSRGTAIDSAQPISAALYSLYGMPPRMPLLHLIGDVHRPEKVLGLPAGVVATPFEAIAGGRADGSGHRELAATVGAIDTELLGYDHPQDHRYLRGSGRRGFLYRDASGTVLGYAYGSEIGRVGPVAVLRPDLLGPVLGHILVAIRPRGASAAWVPGSATDAVTTLLAAGLRIEEFPILACWDRPSVDYNRYLPISPGLL